MDNVPNPVRYPIPQDDRLTNLVVGLVADLLTHRGFPPVFSEPDVERLREALSVFLYGPHTHHDAPAHRPVSTPIAAGPGRTGRTGN